MTAESNAEVERERTMAFRCPDCGEENPLYGKPSEFKNRIFSCEGCGVKVKIGKHRSTPP